MSERSKLVGRLDRAFSSYIRRRDGNRCVICGAPATDAAHYFGRSAHSTRWNERNVYANCRSCNWRHTHNTEPYRRFMLTVMTEDELGELERLHHTSVKYSDAMLEEMIQFYRGKR